MSALYVCAVLMPLVGGLHRFACCMGYHRRSLSESWGEAWRVAAVLAAAAFVVVVVVAVKEGG